MTMTPDVPQSRDGMAYCPKHKKWFPLDNLHDRLLEQQFGSDEQPQEPGMHFDQTSEYCDSVLAKEFTELSIKERGNTYEELHGVSDIISETPEFVQQRLEQMENELNRIEDKPAYDLAYQQNPSFVKNSSFRLAFLRADQFEAENASKRYVFYYEEILRYFGTEFLTKRIQFSDLDADDQAVVRAGQMQILPMRDTSDRPIYTNMNLVLQKSYKSPRNAMRAVIYFLSKLAEDEENQKRGIVMIVTQLQSVDATKVNRELAAEYAKLMKFLPLRSCALHYCINDPVFGALARILLLGGHSSLRSRFRFHSGTYTEVMYSLMSYGIPVKCYPMNEKNVIKLASHKRWISRQIEKDKAIMREGSFGGIDLPTKNDVLIGKGRPLQDHPGNVQLRRMVQEHLEEYTSAKKASKHVANEEGTKIMVIRKVLDLVEASSGRFLTKDDNDWWHVAPVADAHEKVLKAFSGAQAARKNFKSKLSPDTVTSLSFTETPSLSGNSDGLFFMPRVQQNKKVRREQGTGWGWS